MKRKYIQPGMACSQVMTSAMIALSVDNSGSNKDQQNPSADTKPNIWTDFDGENE